ncbi:ANTAR domain-containing protein [Mycobacterium malmoense]|uniref:ANTAR domain-containing protein n=1 Tax=Mycobacterium malmoense TaxID=1780 RepID=UPI0008F83C59|nr:ANTAR domain-containing protein [Mycobacterium malmoense]OIN79891.1 hypothetical protein BMG05_15595 [Mycobacterium malmoense]
MIETLASQQHPGASRQQASRALDTAVGILVGWRRCSTHTAFRELLSASERHGVPLFKLASALVALASGGSESGTDGAEARLAAEKEWGLNYLL